MRILFCTQQVVVVRFATETLRELFITHDRADLTDLGKLSAPIKGFKSLISPRGPSWFVNSSRDEILVVKSLVLPCPSEFGPRTRP